MKRIATKKWTGTAVMALGIALTIFGLANAAQQDYTLSVAGHSGQTKVLQMNGKSYVELEALARIVNGSLSFKGNQVTLTLAADGMGAATSAPAPPQGFSRDFMNSGIEYMSQIREWRNTLSNAIANGFPLTEEQFTPYRGQAATSLRLATVAATTDSDRSASQLLNNEFENMKKLTDKYLAARANLNFIAPDALLNDPLNMKVLNCAKALGAMASAGQFTDDSACH